MRELNPRAWSIDGECWCTMVYYDGHKKSGLGIAPVLAPDNRSKRIGQIEDTNIIVELPTGLKDKNGKEIYEGDIVKNIDSKLGDVGVIKFSEKLARYSVYWGMNPCMAKEIKLDGMFIIGNIHENPELLDKEKE